MKLNYYDCKYLDLENVYDGEDDYTIYSCTHKKSGICTMAKRHPNEGDIEEECRSAKKKEKLNYAPDHYANFGC